MGDGRNNISSEDSSSISGGSNNTSSGEFSSIGGGQLNSATTQGASVGGGASNSASEYVASVCGGENNSASGIAATVAGGIFNTASGQYSTVAGGAQNQAGGDYSFAGGYSAHVRNAAETKTKSGDGDRGTFVWADDIILEDPVIPGSICLHYITDCAYTPEFDSTGPNQFLVRANGGFALNGAPVSANVAMTIHAPDSNPGYASIFLQQDNFNGGMLISSGDATAGSNNNASFYVDQFSGTGHTRRLSLDGTGNLTVTAQAYKPGGGAWAASSDARLKTNVQPLDNALDRLLSPRGVTFEYSQPDNSMHPSGTFTGFIAQEVEPVFPNWIGHDDKGYLTIGPQGFEALTVESLRALKTEGELRKSEMSELKAENVALRKQLAQQQNAQESDLAEMRQQISALRAASSSSKIGAETCGQCGF